MTSPPFVSYAQNGEDVVLWRALRDVANGVYVDVGANHPVDDSVTKAFYDRGWHGLDVEPVAEFASALRAARSRDVVAEVAVAADDGGEVLLHEFPGTGLSTVRGEYVAATVDRGHEVHERAVPTRTLQSLVDEHLAGQQVHFCKVDVEGAEAEVLASADLRRWRPWVLVVEATRPNDTQPTHGEWEAAVLSAGYRLCLFDGLSRFYVADEHADALQARLSYPACSLDGYRPAQVVHLERSLHDLGRAHADLVQQVERMRSDVARVEQLDREVDGLRRELVRWRGVVLERWATATTGSATVAQQDARRELEAMQRTVSWRITAPLRAVRARQRSLAA